MDRSAIGSIETRGAERRLVRQRQIDQRLTNPGHVAAVRRFRRAARPAFERIGIGAVGDELDDAAERACAIERPLRAAQHLDPRDVERVELAREDRDIILKSEERRVRKEWGSKCKTRWCPYNSKKKNYIVTTT